VKDDFVKPIAILTIICLIVSGALSLTNGATAPIIEMAEAERQVIAMSAIIPEATGFERIEDVAFPRTIRDAYRTDNDVGYIIITSINGFSGEVRVICGIDNDGNIISSATLQHSETKGIGDILDRESWTDQFDGKDSRLEGVSTVSGATISTTAYMNAIREAFAAFELVREV